MDEISSISNDLVQLARLALAEKTPDVRLFAARLVRKYRSQHPDIAGKLDSYLRMRPERGLSPLREASSTLAEPAITPADMDSRLSLLRVDPLKNGAPPPILASHVQTIIGQLLHERTQSPALASRGLSPARSAIFVGPPGVGKTMAARFIARQLDAPLLVLDLAAVISSFLGRSGVNVRAAFAYARSIPCVLLLDEIDAVAKRRTDDADVGELKRLVTVIMQEVDEWPAKNLLLAATNHPELIDRALWRRFDLIIEFPLPGHAEFLAGIERFAESDWPVFRPLSETLAAVSRGHSLSDVERTVQRTRRGLALQSVKPQDMLEAMLPEALVVDDHQARIDLAVESHET